MSESGLCSFQDHDSIVSCPAMLNVERASSASTRKSKRYLRRYLATARNKKRNEIHIPLTSVDDVSVLRDDESASNEMMQLELQREQEQRDKDHREYLGRLPSNFRANRLLVLWACLAFLLVTGHAQRFVQYTGGLDGEEESTVGGAGSRLRAAASDMTAFRSDFYSKTVPRDSVRRKAISTSGNATDLSSIVLSLLHPKNGSSENTTASTPVPNHSSDVTKQDADDEREDGDDSDEGDEARKR